MESAIVWVIHKEEGMDNTIIYDDVVYLKKETAETQAKELNKSALCSYYVDYLEINAE